jgi:hypothetical protein
MLRNFAEIFVRCLAMYLWSETREWTWWKRYNHDYMKYLMTQILLITLKSRDRNGRGT